MRQPAADPVVPTEARPTVVEIVGAGVVAGGLGGVAMLLWLVVSAAVVGMSPLAPLTMMGATFAAAGAPAGGVGTALYGAALHLVTSALYGIPFATVLGRKHALGAATVLGIAYAMAVMALMTTSIVPAVNPVMQARLPAIGGSFVIAQALYGVGLGATPLLRRRLAARARPPLAPVTPGA